MTTGVARIKKTLIGGTTLDINVLTAFQGDEVFVETKPLDFDSPYDKEIQMLIFNITSRGSIDNLQCYVSYAQRLNDTFITRGPFSLSTQDTTLWLPRKKTNANYIPQARYFILKIEDLLPVVTWKLSGIEAFGWVHSEETGRGPKGRL